MVKQTFISAIQNESLQMIRNVEKGECHTHVARGGTITDYRKEFGVPKCKIPPQFDGYNGMEIWYADNIKKYYNNAISIYLKRIKLALRHMVSDGIMTAIITYGKKEIDLFNSYQEFVECQKLLYKKFAPNIQFVPELGINTVDSIDEIESEIDDILKLGFFESIDIHGPEMTNPHEYKKIYYRAFSQGLTLRAHVGETGDPEIIKTALKVLELDEINHGNMASKDILVMKEIYKRGIRVNMCPYSNIYLGIYNSLREHPIRLFFDYGINCTVGTDDMLIFNKSISEIFLELYQQRVFSAEELDVIRRNALRR